MRFFPHLVILYSTLSQCALEAGWVEEKDGKTVIHVLLFTLPDPSRTDTFTRAEVAAVNEFKRRFPQIFRERYLARYKANPEKYGKHNWENVSVDLHKFSGISVEGVETALMAIAGKSSPDVMYVNFRQSHTYISNGFLYPLDKAEDGYLSSMTDEQKNFRIHEKIWPVIRRTGPSGERHVWAVPYGGALGKVVLYRKDLFEKKGVPMPHNNWTWDDMYHAVKKIADPANGLYGIRFGRGKHESWYWVTFLWSAGADCLVYDQSESRWKTAFDTREAAVALDYYTRLCNEEWTDEGGKRRFGYAAKDAAIISDKWDRGQIGMQFSYIDEKQFTSINPDVTGMVPVPLGPTGMRGAELNSRMMGIFADVESPAVRDAAWEYIRFYDSKDAMRIKTRIMVEGGLGKFLNPKYLNMFGYPEIVRLAPKGWAECFEIAVDSGKPEPYGKGSNFAYDIMTEPIHQAEELARAGELPPNVEERLDILQGLLKTAVAQANREMLQEYSDEEMQKRRLSALVALIAIVIVFGLVFRKIVRVFTPEDALERGSAWGFRKFAWAYFLLIPALLTIFVWQYVPLFRGSIMAFQDYRIMGGSKWIWLDNFGHLIWDPSWWMSVWNSLRYSFLVIALTFLPPVILAILLQEVPSGKYLFRTIYYLPAVISGLVVIILWKMFYDSNETGALNAIMMRIPAIGYLVLGLLLFGLMAAFARRVYFHEKYTAVGGFVFVGLILFYTCCALAWPILKQDELPFLQRLFATLPEPYRWLDDSSTAMFCCVLPMIWAGMGPGCLIYLAALKGIADDFYEAADVDGATFIDKILFIVFPILKPLIIINFIGVFIGSWNSTANILVMTGGGANTEVTGLHIFYKAFIYLKFGPATAMAWMLGFMLIGFTVHQLRILSRMEFRTTGDKD